MDPTEQIDPSAAPRGRPARPERQPGSGGPAPADVVEIGLRDGSRVWVRPIRPEDRERMVTGLSWLSDRSRYLRFHTHVDRLTDAQLDYLVDVDHIDHEALVALDPDAEGHPGVAVARYIRLPDDPDRDQRDVAEAAITVVDAYQGLGLGTALIGLLEQAAHEHGIRTFRNYVLAENTAMLEIFRQLDGDVVAEGPGLYRVDVPVPGVDDEQPDTPAGRWVASIGRTAPGEPSAWAYPFVWVLRKVAGVDGDADEDVDGAEDPPPRSGLLKRLAGEVGAQLEGDGGLERG